MLGRLQWEEGARHPHETPRRFWISSLSRFPFSSAIFLRCRRLRRWVGWRLGDGRGGTDGPPDGDPDPGGGRRGARVRGCAVAAGGAGEAVGGAGDERGQERARRLPHRGGGGPQWPQRRPQVRRDSERHLWRLGFLFFIYYLCFIYLFIFLLLVHFLNTSSATSYFVFRKCYLYAQIIIVNFAFYLFNNQYLFTESYYVFLILKFRRNVWTVVCTSIKFIFKWYFIIIIILLGSVVVRVSLIDYQKSTADYYII